MQSDGEASGVRRYRIVDKGFRGLGRVQAAAGARGRERAGCRRPDRVVGCDGALNASNVRRTPNRSDGRELCVDAQPDLGANDASVLECACWIVDVVADERVERHLDEQLKVEFAEQLKRIAGALRSGLAVAEDFDERAQVAGSFERADEVGGALLVARESVSRIHPA